MAKFGAKEFGAETQAVYNNSTATISKGDAVSWGSTVTALENPTMDPGSTATTLPVLGVKTGAAAFDMVVVNLYPFQKTVTDPEATPERARANIDIGGPCMIRAAAKNYLRVASVVDPGDYESVLGELEGSGGYLSLETRFRLAQKTFSYTSEYDTAIAAYLGSCRQDQLRKSYREVRR